MWGRVFCGAMGQWGDGAMGQWGNWAMGQWGNGAMGHVILFEVGLSTVL